MRARTRWIHLQRKLTHRLQAYAQRLLGGMGPELKKYLRQYQKNLNDFREVSTKRELIARLTSAHIVLCGDYHTLSQAQRTVIRLLREAIPVARRRRQRIVLALEMVRPKDNARIARFLAGKISEAEFLEGIGFRKNWGFQWSNYRRLFLFAGENGVEVVGINDPGRGRRTLKAKDRYAARVLADLSQRDSRAVVCALIGDLHLAPRHLPLELERELRRRKLDRRTLVIHQNIERFYWRLADLGLEQLVDVVKVNDGVYCVMSTPPWVKLRSNVRWNELMSESDSLLVGGVARSRPGSEDPFAAVNYAEEIQELVTMIESFLGEEHTRSDDFHVYGPGDLSFLNRLAESPDWTRFELRIVAKCLGEFESSFIPREKILFLTNLSLNHAATQAAIYLHAKRSGRDVIFQHPHEDFYPAIWVEALGYLGSKIVNHKRQCNGPSDLRQIALTGARESDRRAARAALDHLAAEKDFLSGKRATFRAILLPHSTRNVDRILFYWKVARLLGQLLGDALHAAAMRNRIGREPLRQLFRDPFTSGAQARKLYLRWIRILDHDGLREVRKTERL